MDLLKMKLFALTAETQNISKTAELSGYTQSGVSHTLKRLEEEVGLTLFSRDRYGVHLTAVGAEFLTYVKNVLSEMEKLDQFVYDLHGYEVGSLTIGTYSSICSHWLPKILSSFQPDHPFIKIHIREGGIKEIESWIKHKDVDFALCSHQKNSPYEFISLQMDPFMAILPSNFEYNIAATDFPVNLFSQHSSIMPDPDVDSDIHLQLKSNHVSPKISFSAKDNQSILAMVEQGLGISLVPKLSLYSTKRDLRVLPTVPLLQRNLGVSLLSQNELSPIAKKFLWYIQDYFNQQSNE